MPNTTGEENQIGDDRTYQIMKECIKNNLVRLPRSFRLWWGKVFLYMLGKVGTHEFNSDFLLWKELETWLKNKGEEFKS